MNFLRLTATSFLGYQENNVIDSSIAEKWSFETLSILRDKLTIGNVIDQDFSPMLQDFGDTVNIQRPNKFSAKNKDENDDVTVQTSTLTNVPVVLNQLIHTSFRIRDQQLSLSIHDLIRLFLEPAAVSLAERIDRILLGQVYRFRQNRVPGANNVVGDLNAATVDNVKRLILQSGEQLHRNSAPTDNRWMFITPGSQTTIQELDIFNTADKVGDQGQALESAIIGTKLGFTFAMGQNVSEVLTATSPAVQADELSADVAIGDTVIAVDAGGGFAVGEYITLEGDLQPYRITAISGNNVTIFPSARRAILATASDIQQTNTGLVDLAGHSGVTAYPLGYKKQIKVDGTGVPSRGQLVSFNTAGTPNVTLAGEYSIVEVDLVGGTFIELDRPLETAIIDNDVVGYGHAGAYNFALVPNALTMVTRTLATPPGGIGALSDTATIENLSMRTTLSYEGLKQGTLVTMDILMGVQILDENFGIPVLF